VSPTALVTGAAGGIGAAVVRRLADDGCMVIATDLRAPTEPESRARVRFATADLRVEQELEGVLSLLGNEPLDYLVNAAGVAMFDADGSVLDTPEEVWETTLGINLHAVRRITVLAVPRMRGGHGRSIVNVASVAGLRGMDSPLDAYQVSKAAVVSLTRSLALQLAPEGIRCNTVCPGAILTPMIAHLYERSPARRDDMEKRTPMRRLGTPEDVAGVVAFLLSDDAAFVTATDVVVDGGWTAAIK
jgi:NAD(P)-dependent dehydrogenase (short-subunit alcohol dehydrogenase family)